MYNVLVVDDDSNIRERIISNMPWRRLGIGDVFEAADSETAMDTFTERRPHIVVTDIRIPTRDGLELSQDMQAIDGDVQIIAITGYQDFDVAQKAIERGVINLIKKPLVMGELEEAIGKAVARLGALREQKLHSDEIQQLLDRSVPSMREQFFAAFLGGREVFESEQELRDKLADMRISFTKPYHGAVVCAPAAGQAGGDLKLMLAAVRNIAEELISAAGFDIKASFSDGRQHIMLLGMDDVSAWDTAEGVLTNLFIKYNFYFGVDVISGLGSVHSSLLRLPDSLNEARGALYYYKLFGSNGAVNIKNVIRMENPFLPVGRQTIEEAIELFRARDADAFFAKLDLFFDQAAFISLGNIDMIKHFVNELCVTVMRCAIGAGVKPDVFTGENSPYTRLTALYSAEDIRQWARDFCRWLFECMESMQHKKESHVVRVAMDFLNAHFTKEDMSLSQVCGEVQLTPGYFSRLFKQETGMSVSEYLNSVRIEQAKRLLRESRMKIYEIAYAVGYSNPKYFNHVFKNATGQPPLDYRNSAG